jgi:tetratricopeptide (TPR) repeat protein
MARTTVRTIANHGARERSIGLVALAAVLGCALAGAAHAGAQDAGTPAERKIAVAQKKIDRDPKHFHGYNELALALTLRARETADPGYYTKAEETLRVSLSLSPDNFEALKVKAWLLLGQHRFRDALELAKTLNTRVPDDVMVYGMLVDASAELGDYDVAEQAAQWMLDLRPGNIPALTRAAYLREIFGDIEGALELMRSSLARLPIAETEDRAWVLTHISLLELTRRDTAAAETAAKMALDLFPRYHYGLAAMARVRSMQGRHAERADLLRTRYEVAPHPENLFDLGEALAAAGQSAEATRVYREFEAKARAEMEGPDNANRELIKYYAGPGRRADEALRIARLEIERRGDVFTRDAYAWALFKNGRVADARAQMKQVLDVGVRDLGVLEHADAIMKGEPRADRAAR